MCMVQDTPGLRRLITGAVQTFNFFSSYQLTSNSTANRSRISETSTLKIISSFTQFFLLLYHLFTYERSHLSTSAKHTFSTFLPPQGFLFHSEFGVQEGSDYHVYCSRSYFRYPGPDSIQRGEKTGESETVPVCFREKRGYYVT